MQIPIGRIALGRWGGPAGEELILCRRDAEQIEIHCHGGVAAVKTVITRLVDEGCQRLSWPDWVARNSPDGIRAAAQIALADAVTERTAAILVDQLNGALATEVRGLIADVSAAKWPTVAEKIGDLLNRKELGLHLTKPWRVVVFGAPNVGKSSLINAIAGYERAIVSDIPGTTRDVVTVTTAIDGWPVQLSDTAGFRITQDELESAGIELATAALSKAELAIFVHDAANLHGEPRDEATKIVWPTPASRARTIHVINKIDLISVADRPELAGRFNSPLRVGDPHMVSALTGEGIADLISAIGRSLAPVSLPAGSAVPFTTEQVDRLTAAQVAVEHCDAAAATELLHALLTNIPNLKQSSL